MEGASMSEEQELLDIAADIELRLTKDWRQYPGHLRRAAQACRQLVELRAQRLANQAAHPADTKPVCTNCFVGNPCTIFGCPNVSRP
jgi:hypothetical protein